MSIESLLKVHSKLLQILRLPLRQKTTLQGQFCRAMSSPARLDISGIYPPIVTPFNEKAEIAYDKLQHNVDLWNQAPLRGLVVQGSNGEYVYLNKTERVEMVRRVRQMVPKDRLVIGGSGCESTQETIEMTNQMADAGADAVMVVTPCYYKGHMTPPVMEKHYTAVADASKVPVILYSVPSNTGIELAADVVVKLAKHPNIIGLKDSGGDITRLGSLVHLTKAEDFQILAGSASFLYPAHMIGCVGGVCALANALPKEVCELEGLYKQGKHEEAKLLQHRLIRPNTAVIKRFGIPGLKKAMEFYGFYGGPTRLPLQPLTADEIEALRGSFTADGFL